MLGWAKKQTRAFGTSFIWLVCLIYFTQGFRSFVWTAVSYQLKDKLKLSPSTSQYVSSIAFFPWSIKPLYGIVSDCIPIKGRKRIPYLIISTILSLVPWPILGLISSSRSSVSCLVILLTFQNIGSAMADVVIDAMIAEAVRFERSSFAGDLQSISWFSMALGGIFGSLLGGYALSSLPTETIFLLFSILPSLQLVSCVAHREKPSRIKVFPVNETDVVLSGEKKSISRRKKPQISEKKDLGIKEVSKRNSLKTASKSLLLAFKQPLILRPMTWFFLANIMVPNLSTVMFYFQTEKLNLGASFLGTSRVVGWVGLMLGTLFYNRYLKKIKLRMILMWTQIALSCLSLIDMVLVSRVNLKHGISDKFMVLVGSALADGINQFKFMPFLILSGQLCPPGIEGTLFALFMSINNLGSTLGNFHGAALASLFNLSSGSYDRIIVGLFVQFICVYLPVAFLFLVPREATGVSAQ